MSGETVCIHGVDTSKHCMFCCNEKDCKKCERELDKYTMHDDDYREKYEIK